MWTKQKETAERIVWTNTRTGEECSLSAIYTHAELGTFYMFDNFMSMPFTRKYIFDVVQQHERIGMEKEELVQKMHELKTILEANQPGASHQAYAIAHQVETTLKDGWDLLKSSLMIAAMCIVSKDEDISKFDQQHAERKINEWSKAPGMLDFFLNYLHGRMADFSKPFA